jgi:hypothetical protein
MLNEKICSERYSGVTRPRLAQSARENLTEGLERDQIARHHAGSPVQNNAIIHLSFAKTPASVSH